jgi:hypothetical protein
MTAPDTVRIPQVHPSAKSWNVLSVDEFSISATSTVPRPVLHQGKRVATVEARVIEAQFRFPDGSTLLLASDDEPFEERLTLLYLGPDLRERDRVLVGGAYTPGFLAYAEPRGPAEVAFCWHDLEQVVAIRPRHTWFGLRTRWLTVRDLIAQQDLG